MALTRFGSPLRFLVPLLPLVLLLAACGQAQTTAISSVGATLSPPTSAGARASVYPLTLTDDAGRSITLPARPGRIVSLAPSNTEIVCALGFCATLTGVTDFDDYPASVKSVAKVVVQAKVDAEKVVAARPDLVLAAGNGLTPDSVIQQLTGLGLKVLALYPKDLDGVYGDIALIGRALAAPDEARATVESMKARVKAVTDGLATASRPRTFYEVSVFEGTIYAAGKDSFLSSLISVAGGVPVMGDAHSGAIQLEDLIAADPQLILLGDASYDPSFGTRQKALAALRARSGWGQITAVRDGKVVPFTDDVVTTRPGPRIVDGLEALARAIHPEIFSR